MKLSMFCADFVTKYRISSHIWKSGNSVFDSIDSNSITKQFYQRVTVCNSTCFGHSFHTALALRAKSYQEKENEYAHSIMENLPSYRGSVVKNPVPAVGISTSSISSEIVKEFAQAGVREASPGTEETDKHLIFVYGTLKRNEPNHDIIQDTSEGSATYIGLGWSVEKWPLVIASRYNIPFLLHTREKGKHITGELYQVDDRMLATMDKLECHPKYYTRVQEEVQPEDPAAPPVKPWIYFLMNYKEEMLHLPCLENYTSKGPHGLEYVARYNRTQGEYHRDVQM